ncbi:MAG: VCBS repeat-containing protein, partial [Rhodobacteraceae bacterium]|nr:VCBS repeat-containing protein [Paracoccaceae bacterium]
MTTPIFTQRTGGANPLDTIDAGSNNAPVFVDIDGDGDLDIVAGNYVGNFLHYRNTGTASAPAFTLIEDDGDDNNGLETPFHGLNVYSDDGVTVLSQDDIDGGDTGYGYAQPAFVDLDNDGDLDLVSGHYYGTFFYFENTGGTTAPAFAARVDDGNTANGVENPFHGLDVGLNSTTTFGDLDDDGDLDLVAGAHNGILVYYENTGTATAPAFTERTGNANPLDTSVVTVPGTRTAPTLADVDRDNDLDLVVGNDDGTFYWLENTGNASTPAFTLRADDGDAQNGLENPFHGFDVGSTSAPALGDVDGDGDLDLVAGTDVGSISYFENTGTNTAPVFEARVDDGDDENGLENPFHGFRVNVRVDTDLGDLDGDGDLDLVVADGSGEFHWFENTSPASTPTEEEDTPPAPVTLPGTTSGDDVLTGTDVAEII